MGDRLIPAAMGHDVARRIDGARFESLAGPDHLVFIHNSEAIPDAIERFLDDIDDEITDPEDDRVLAAILCIRGPLGELDRRVTEVVQRFGGERGAEDDDRLVARFTRAARAVRCAVSLLDVVRDSSAGVHVGECTASGKRVEGDAVHIAVQVAGLAAPRELLVTSTVIDVVAGSGLSFTPAGSHRLAGTSRDWELHRYHSDAPGPLVASGYETDVRNVTWGD
ncbi:MAG: hypothetical protein Q8K58_16475 [Acidimicrobiales bacterium]|nr:hypothetical protein [Acidimicrobiales bacterium]